MGPTSTLGVPELGTSASMIRVYEAAAGMAKSSGPILIVGEPGTGKERLARWIHSLGSGATNPFVRISKEEVSELFVEQAIFGSNEPAPGSETTRHVGRVERAGEGTLYVHEIREFATTTQAKLVNLMIERSFEVPGSSTIVSSDAHIIFSSQVDAAMLLDRRELYLDLYQRLISRTIHIPALRERKEDVLPLAQLHLRRLSKLTGKEVHELTPDACSALIRFAWPNNLVELEQAIESAVYRCKNTSVGASDLPSTVTGNTEPEENESSTLDTTLAKIEKALIIDALKGAHGNQAKAAKQLGITERMMGLRIKKHAINPRHFRTQT